MATTIATTQSSNSIMHYYQEATGHLEILVLRLLMQKVFVHNRVHIQGFPLIISYRYFALPPKISLAFNWSSHSQSIAVDCSHVCIVFTTNTTGAGSGCSWLGKKSHFFSETLNIMETYLIFGKKLIPELFVAKIIGLSCSLSLTMLLIAKYMPIKYFFREGHSLYLSI